MIQPATSLSTAKRLARAAALELLPPVLHRKLKRALGVGQPTIGLTSTGRTAVKLTTGDAFHHRGTHADREVLKQIFSQSDYDLRRLRLYPKIADFYSRQSRPLIVDCGANIGASAVWFAHTFPKASVLAVEPDAGNFALLSRNSISKKITPLHGGVASTSGTISLIDPGEGEWGYRTSATSEAGRQVPAMTIDDVIRNQEGTPFILKIDIEGAEEDVFSKPCAAINRFPVVIVELHDWLLPGRGTSRPFLQWHSQTNRDFVHIGENVFSISTELLG